MAAQLKLFPDFFKRQCRVFRPEFGKRYWIGNPESRSSKFSVKDGTGFYLGFSDSQRRHVFAVWGVYDNNIGIFTCAEGGVPYSHRSPRNSIPSEALYFRGTLNELAESNLEIEFVTKLLERMEKQREKRLISI